MKLTSLQLHEFTAFSTAVLDFAPGVNVLIGENATGKTHVMKVAYGVLRAARELKGSQIHSEVAKEVGDQLSNIFRPHEKKTARLIRRSKRVGEVCQVTVRAGRDTSTFSLDASSRVGVTQHVWQEVPSCVFIPTHDVLALSDSFTALYEDRDIPFDQTYYDLSAAIKSSLKRKAPPLLNLINGILGGEVKHKDGGFYINTGNGDIEAPLCADGLRKIATIAQLVATGSLAEGSILFWDEPETNLNPRIIVQVAGLLRQLAMVGVQVFLTTHDYLLSRKLSLAADSQEEPQVPTKFFSFHRNPMDGQIAVESGNSLLDIAHNPIVLEYTRQYEEELEHFSSAVRESKGGA